MTRLADLEPALNRFVCATSGADDIEALFSGLEKAEGPDAQQVAFDRLLDALAVRASKGANDTSPSGRR